MVYQYTSDTRIPSFFSDVSSAAFCAHYFAARYRSLYSLTDTVVTTLSSRIEEELDAPPIDTHRIATEYVALALCNFHYQYALQLRIGYSQNQPLSTRRHHPANRLRLTHRDVRSFYAAVADRIRYNRVLALEYDLLHHLISCVSRFLSSLRRLYSPVNFDYRSVWAFCDFTTFHLINPRMPRYLHLALTASDRIFALNCHRINYRFTSVITCTPTSYTSISSTIDCICAHSTPPSTMCTCFPVDLSIFPAHHFVFEPSTIVADAQFQISVYEERRRASEHELFMEVVRTDYHPDNADHPDYSTDIDSDSLRDSDDTSDDANSDIASVSSSLPSSQ
jgi:hypothetical protein